MNQYDLHITFENRRYSVKVESGFSVKYKGGVIIHSNFRVINTNPEIPAGTAREFRKTAMRELKQILEITY